jgi:tetratricopeptide (TPR) repeat protein
VVRVSVGGLSVLRLVDRPATPGVVDGARSVTVWWEAPGYAPQKVSVPMAVSVADSLAELIRWYLEEYAEFPSDPAPALAVRAEAMLADLGRRLFQAVFGAGTAAGIWGQASRDGLDRVRVEVDTDPADVPGLPWELLREPGSDRALVLTAGQFVRIHHETATPVPLPDPAADGLRVLLVICRPGGRDDVPFRSVASRLVRGGADQLSWLRLDVLRPATFARLGDVLREAQDVGRPYHVVHFDGHGAYLDTSRLADEDDPGDSAVGVGVSALQYGVSLAGPQRSGRHGYLLFEDPTVASNQQLVDGPTLAGLLVRHRVPVLVLNACRSAYTEPQDDPTDSAPDAVHERIRAYGSLAAEVADAGVAGVVAMRYNVYVVTAAQFVTDLYVQLGGGKSLGHAATTARQQLAGDPTRHIGDRPIALQDWVVPTVYESRPLTLLTPPAPNGGDAPEPAVRIRLDEPAPSRGPAAGGMPGAPDVGFFGRDETLLALDRAFDTSRVVLLHALAGAGKTTTVAEFARWYRSTGGLHHPQLGTGPVLWTSFEHHTPLDRVLDTVGTEFGDLLEAGGVHWAALTELPDRREVALQVLAQVPVLWVWDNVEPVAGFPEGTPSAWTDEEQADLAAFLRDLNTRTRAKVLLTSRRDEQRWLGLMPTRVRLPAMPMAERLQLARAVAEHLGLGAGSEVDWRPLLRFTGGNPLTITVAVRQALRENATSDEALAAFVDRITAGRSALEDPEDVALGRAGSLAASLDYGFSNAFTDQERAILAVLHLFRNVVHVNVVRFMGDARIVEADAVPALDGFTGDAGVALLDRAVDIGLLTSYGNGYYGIHPALSWYFRTLHSEHAGPDDSAAARAYAHALAVLGRYYFDKMESGNTDVLTILRLEEENLLHAVGLARRHHLPESELGVLNALGQLYKATGRDTEWARLVEQVLPDYLTAEGRPAPGQEDAYSTVSQWRVQIAQGRRDLTGATQLQIAVTAWDRERAQPHLDTPVAELDRRARYLIHSLASSENDLGRLLFEQGDPAAALPHFQAHYDLMERIGDTAGQAMAATGLGTNYIALGDLGQAQHWHQRSLDLKPVHNRIGRAVSHGALASVVFERFRVARQVGVSEAELLSYLNAARAGFQQVLDLLPADQHEHRANAHDGLGGVYLEAGDVGQALRHYQQSIYHEEARGNAYGAAHSRYNIALLLGNAGRLVDALHYANAARNIYLTLGPDVIADVRRSVELIDELQRHVDIQDQTGWPYSD